ncbi:MAG: AI-2E family transporter [Methylocystis sp.]|uniref:AI-2E family transporter n=1 Tax=Methylocystis sp. TaxID=1911079 RepID=UPI003942CF19
MDNKVVTIMAALVITFVVLAASSMAQVVIEPVIFAIFIIALIWPLQTALQSRLPKALALLITVVATLGVVMALTSMVVWGGGEIADWTRRNLLKIGATFRNSTTWLESHDIFVMSHVTENFNAAWVVGVLKTIASRVNVLVGFSLLVFIFLVMGLAETEEFQDHIAQLKDQETSVRLLTASQSIAIKFRKYMYVRTIASVATGVVVGGFALLMGLELAAAWAILAFALNYLPYIGPLVVTVLPALFALVQFDSWQTAMVVFVALAVIQFVIGSYLEPLISGSALAISPSVVTFAVVLWTFLWGVPGAFIGVPLAIAFLTLCAQFPSTEWIATMFSGSSRAQSPAD